ncbi:MAG: formylglycine-generating enzyme family protein [Cyanophyceae cyanobacterium]
MLSPFKFDVVIVNPQGQPIKRTQETAHQRLEDLAKEVTLEVVAIAGGMFNMGSPTGEAGWHRTQGPQREVTVYSFAIGKYPVTQAQWQAVAAYPKIERSLNPNPASFQGAQRPVEQVSWYDAVEFCARLSQQTGREYRLPSEAEWEYACRGATQTPFHFGETITTELANYSGVNWEYFGKICSPGSYGEGPLGEDRRETTPVGGFGVANRFGLYDLHGNVREWCADDWHRSYGGAPTKAAPWENHQDSSRKVLRGGSWNDGPHKCRCGYRTKFEAEASLYNIGFRVAASD